MVALSETKASVAPPVPDPTILTTEQLRREITWVKELLQQEVHCKDEVTQTRLSAMDRAVVLLQELTDALPTLWRQEVARLQELHEAKFEAIRDKFAEMSSRTEQTAQGVKQAVDAAFAAAKEAVGEQNKSNSEKIIKAETSFTKQLDSIAALSSTSINSLNDKIFDMKSRLDLIEGRSGGTGATVSWIFGAAGFLAAVGAVVALIAKT